MTSPLSQYLNFLRFAAALAVYLFHVRGFTKIDLPIIGDLGGSAVIVFFVLSGFLITHSGVRQPDGRRFMQARLARLWSVCLPALLLTMVADTIGQHVSMAAYDNFQPYSLFKWVASIGINALFLNQIWGNNIFAGTNGPFWSLSYEFWYYAIFAAFLYFRGAKRALAVGGAVLIVGPKILVGFPIWLLGAATYYAIQQVKSPRVVQGWVIWAGTIFVAIAWSSFNMHAVVAAAFASAPWTAGWGVNFWPISYPTAIVIAANIYGFALTGYSSAGLLQRAGRFIKFGADISFGLYLFHYPLMYLCRALLHATGLSGGPAFNAAMYMLPFAAASYLALQCEHRKDVVSNAISWAIFALQRRVKALSASLAGAIGEDPLYKQDIFDDNQPS